MVLTLYNKQKPVLKRILTTLTQWKGLKKTVLSWSILPVIYSGLVAASSGSYESGGSLTKLICLLPMAKLFFEDPATEIRGQVTIHSLSETFYPADNTGCQWRIDTQSDALLVFNIESSVIPSVPLSPLPLNGDPLLPDLPDLPDKEASDNFFILEPAKEIIKTLAEQKLRADDIKKKAEQYFQWSWQWKWPKHPPLQIRWNCDDEEESPDYCSVYFEIHNEAKKDHEDDDPLLPFEEETAEESQSQVDSLHDLPGQIPEIISNNTVICRFPGIGCHPIPANPNIPWFSSPSENSGDEEPEDEEPEGEEAECEEPEGGKGSPDEGFNNTPQRFRPCNRHLLCTGKQCIFNVVVAPADSTEPNMEPPAKRGKISFTDKPQYELCDSTVSQCANQRTNRQAASHQFTCSICNPPRNFCSARSLSAHKSQSHTREKTCPVCERKFPNSNALAYHKRKEHTGEQICPVCTKPLPNVIALSHHKQKCHTGKKICPDCNETLPSGRALSDHKRKEHTGKQACPYCPSIQPNAGDLSSHISGYHSGKKTCPDCNETLPHARALSYHKRKEHTGKQTCPHCQATLSNVLSLCSHKSQCHSKEQTRSDCNKPLRNRKALHNHKRKEHGGKQTHPDSLRTPPDASAQSDHKKAHRKRKHNDAGQNN